MHRMILNETSYFGAGCRESIAIEAKRRGFKKAFFVTDKDLIRFKVADKVIEVFEKNDIPYEVYRLIKLQEPTSSLHWEEVLLSIQQKGSVS